MAGTLDRARLHSRDAQALYRRSRAMLTKGSPVADIIVVLTQAAQEESDYRDREKRSARKRTNEATRRVTA